MSPTRPRHRPAVPPAPAKLSRPAAGGLLRRDRLFRALDAAARGRLVWLSGPAGAGKTSLVSAWIETRGVVALWYRLDAADADPGTLFQTLRLAVRGRPLPEPLPAFAPTDATRLNAFASRFFAIWCAAFDDATTLVIDNHEQASPESDLGAVLAALLDALPAHLRLVVVSRRGPPAELARWEASPEMTLLDWDELKFSADESTALAASWGVRDAAVVAPIVACCRGWAAGMVLMLRAARAGIALPVDPGDAASTRGMFNYFGAEILARLPGATQQFLLQVAFLHEVTVPLAELVTGEPRASRLLAELHGSNFFVERKQVAAGSVATYEFHPLFRGFLREHARATLPAAELRELRRRAASALEAAGQTDAAAGLLADAGESQRLAALIEQHAGELARGARFATLGRWIDRLDARTVECLPRMRFWQALCKLAARSTDSAAAIATARDACDAADDVVGSFAVRCWMMLTSSDLEVSRALLVELDGIVRKRWSGLTLAQQIEALSHFKIDLRTALAIPLMRTLRAEVEPLFEQHQEPGVRLDLGIFLLMEAVCTGDNEHLERLEPPLRALLDAGHGTLLQRASCLVYFSFRALHAGTCADNRRVLDELQALGDVGGFHIDQALVWLSALRAALMARDHAAAEVLERRVRPVVRRIPWRYILFLLSAVLLRLQQGRVADAEADVRELLALTPPESPTRSRALLAAGLIALAHGRNDEAVEQLTCALDIARHVWGHPGNVFTALMFLAVARSRAGRTGEARDALVEALQLSRSAGLLRIWTAWDPVAGEACALALEWGIDPERVEQLIRAGEIPPPAMTMPAWPWPRRLHTLGGCTLEGDDKPAPRARRQLDLLLYLVSRGGASVAVGAAMDALWPDAEGDAAKKSLEITLHRLRGLLGDAAAVRQEGGRLTLNWRLCWVDAWVFGTIAERVVAGEGNVEEERRVLALYRGPFLGDACEATWAQPYRERLEGLHRRLLERHGSRAQAGAKERSASGPLLRVAAQQR